MVSIIIPTLNEEKYITKLLTSLSSYPSVKEIIIIDALSVDNTIEKVLDFKKKINPNNLEINIKKNPQLLQGYALNIGIVNSKYSLIVRIDAHSIIKDYDQKIDYFFNIKTILEKDEICSIGFKQRFMFDNFFQSSLFILSTTPFLSQSKYRYVNSQTLTKDTAWLIAFKKENISQVGFFNPTATPNEDYEFNQRLIKKTLKNIMIYPEFPIYYSPRSNLRGLALQYFRYGSSRIRTMKSLGLLNQSLKKVLLIIYLITLLLLSVFLFLSILFLPSVYFIIFIVISIFYLNQYYRDEFIFSKYLVQKKQKIVFIVGMIFSPLISALPLIFRNLGMIFKLLRS